MNRIHLATALIRRGGAVLLVASRYPNHREPLWNLPGGRQQPHELLPETVVREVHEETGLRATGGALLYVSESYDGENQFTNCTFDVRADGEVRVPANGDHVADVRWVALESVEEHIAVRVVREPLLAYLRGELLTRYAGYADADISIVFPDD